MSSHENDPDHGPEVLDEKDAAEMLLTDANQIRKWANAGIIPAHRVPGGRRYSFLREELLTWARGEPS
ncbi:MAG: helix-turn-helix domain-containing protein [Actinomycetota bacterium]